MVLVFIMQQVMIFQKTPIHNLEVAKLDIRFGKYSKNGIMVLAKQGTVIDVGKNTSNLHIIGVSFRYY